MSILFFFILIPPILYFQFYFRRIILCFYPHPNIFIRLFSWIFALLLFYQHIIFFVFGLLLFIICLLLH